MECKPQDQEEQFPKDQVVEDKSKYQEELMTSLSGRYCYWQILLNGRYVAPPRPLRLVRFWAV